MTKFKVGDKVRILEGSKISGYTGGYTREMMKFIGKIDTIVSIDTVKYSPFIGYYLLNTASIWDERGLEFTDLQMPSITISQKKNGKVTAVLKDGNTYIKHSNAKCSHDDTFDFSIGAELALKRLFGIENKSLSDCTNEELISELSNRLCK